jgi:hypothetical protein
VGGVPIVVQVCAEGLFPTGPTLPGGSVVDPDGEPEGSESSGDPIAPVQPVQTTIATRERNFIEQQANKMKALASS